MTTSKLCPLCAATLNDPNTIEVCAHCHAGLQAAPHAALTATGEFPAITNPTLSELPPIRRKTDAGQSQCSWCNKPADDVRKLLSQGHYHICNECVSLCADILRMELGDDFG